MKKINDPSDKSDGSFRMQFWKPPGPPNKKTQVEEKCQIEKNTKSYQILTNGLTSLTSMIYIITNKLIYNIIMNKYPLFCRSKRYFGLLRLTSANLQKIMVYFDLLRISSPYFDRFALKKMLKC